MAHRNYSDCSKVIEKVWHGKELELELDKTFDIFLRDLSNRLLPSRQVHILSRLQVSTSPTTVSSISSLTTASHYEAYLQMSIQADLFLFQHMVEK